VREYAVHGVGDRRVHRATSVIARPEHEVVNQKLGSPVEQLAERLLAVVRIQAVVLLQPHPRQFTPPLRDLVAEPGVLLFADEERVARGEPFLTCSDPVLSHLLGHLSRSFSSSQLRGRLAAPSPNVAATAVAPVLDPCAP
jgi:hypothetical protein